jgi:hypothetical protein
MRRSIDQSYGKVVQPCDGPCATGTMGTIRTNICRSQHVPSKMQCKEAAPCRHAHDSCTADHTLSNSSEHEPQLSQLPPPPVNFPPDPRSACGPPDPGGLAMSSRASLSAVTNSRPMATHGKKKAGGRAQQGTKKRRSHLLCLCCQSHEVDLGGHHHKGSLISPWIPPTGPARAALNVQVRAPKSSIRNHWCSMAWRRGRRMIP